MYGDRLRKCRPDGPDDRPVRCGASTSLPLSSGARAIARSSAVTCTYCWSRTAKACCKRPLPKYGEVVNGKDRSQRGTNQSGAVLRLKMIPQDYPGLDGEGTGLGQRAEAPDEVVQVVVTVEEELAVEPPAHHTIEDA